MHIASLIVSVTFVTYFLFAIVSGAWGLNNLDSTCLTQDVSLYLRILVMLGSAGIALLIGFYLCQSRCYEDAEKISNFPNWILSLLFVLVGAILLFQIKLNSELDESCDQISLSFVYIGIFVSSVVLAVLGLIVCVKGFIWWKVHEEEREQKTKEEKAQEKKKEREAKRQAVEELREKTIILKAVQAELAAEQAAIKEANDTNANISELQQSLEDHEAAQNSSSLIVPPSTKEPSPQKKRENLGYKAHISSQYETPVKDIRDQLARLHLTDEELAKYEEKGKKLANTKKAQGQGWNLWPSG